MEAKDRRPENPCKRYVKVRADFELDGRIRPSLFREEDGPAFRIDRVLDASGRVAQGGRTGNPLCVRGGGQHRRPVPRRAVLVYRAGRERVESLTKSANRRVAGTMCLSGVWGCPNQQSAGFASGRTG